MNVDNSTRYSLILNYLSSPSTVFGLIIGGIMYVSYAMENQAWLNSALVFISLFVAVIIPSYSKFSNKVEEKINFKTVNVTYGRLGRYIVQLVMNLFIFTVLLRGNVIKGSNISVMGGVLGISIITTIASQGLQYIAIMLSNREYGDKNRNVLIALSINTIITSLATLGLVIAREAFLVVGIVSAILVFGMGIASDLRAIFYPKRGVGVFFGTFNPFHKSHADILKKALAERKLSKILIHPTVIPKLHADALRKGEIIIGEYKDGMRIYQKTGKADFNVNYFPTGNRFYEHATREFLIRKSLVEYGLDNKVEVLSMPNIYEKKGFYGIMAKIKKQYSGVPLHGIHGSDLGGMWVRSIYDESGWLYPLPIKRIDNVSATAIRNGAKGMATKIVDEIIEHLRKGEVRFEIDGEKLVVNRGVLSHE